MKALSILIFTISIFYGQILNFKTYQANFVQTIINSSDKLYLESVLKNYIKRG